MTDLTEQLHCLVAQISYTYTELSMNMNYNNQHRWSGIWGFAFVLLIPLFAFFYSIMSDGSFHGYDGSFWNGLYYSVVTITTLGFGDVYPTLWYARLLTSLEVLFGVIIIGFFLNAVATEQAKDVDKKSQERLNKDKRNDSSIKLLQVLKSLIPQLQVFLTSCYEVLTPINERSFPNNIFEYEFTFKYNKMYDLYATSLLMVNKIQIPVIESYFKWEHKVCDECRYLLTNVDLSYWKELQEALSTFRSESSAFVYEEAIVSARNVPMGQEGKKLSDLLVEMIKNGAEDEKMLDGNLRNQNVALLHHIRILVGASKEIYKFATIITNDKSE